MTKNVVYLIYLLNQVLPGASKWLLKVKTYRRVKKYATDVLPFESLYVLELNLFF